MASNVAASSSRWCPKAINQAWRDRTVMILVQPTPITFAERRSVLQVLQRNGEIQVFRQTWDSKARFVAVTKDEQTTTDLLRQKRLSYNVSIPKSLPDISFANMTTLDSTVDIKGRIHSGETSRDEPDEEGRVHKNFTVRVSGFDGPDGLFYHSGALNDSPLLGSWPERFTRDETMTSSILKESLPPNMTAKAFARWDYDLSHQGIVSRKAQRLEAAACLPSKMKSPAKLRAQTINKSTHDDALNMDSLHGVGHNAVLEPADTR